MLHQQSVVCRSGSVERLWTLTPEVVGSDAGKGEDPFSFLFVLSKDLHDVLRSNIYGEKLAKSNNTPKASVSKIITRTSTFTFLVC